jgi:pimeloyl-ACP methyl ester carboxylesterase
MILQTSRIGTGLKVVFLHGFLESSTMWDYLNPHTLGLDCLYIDLPGHGKSPTFEEVPSISNMAEYVHETLQHNQFVPDAIVGHSMGGYVALELLQLIDKPTKCILLNSNFWDDSEQKKQDRNRVIDVVKHNKDFFIREVIPGLFSKPTFFQQAVNDLISEACNMSVKGITDATAAMRDRKNNSELTKHNEIHVIQGEFDALIPYDHVLEMQKEFPFNIHLIPTAGHMAHIESTDKTKEVFKSIVFYHPLRG